MLSERDHIKILIIDYTRRLQILEEQKALQGLGADPAIQIKIEDIKTVLRGLIAINNASTEEQMRAVQQHSENRENVEVRPSSDPIDIGMQIIKLLWAANEGFSSNEISRTLNVKEADVSKELSEMIRDGRIIRYEKDGITKYKIAPGIINRYFSTMIALLAD